MVFLTGLLPASCHKGDPQPKAAPSATVAAGTNAANAGTRNLGEISLTNHSETSFHLSTGQYCTLTPKLIGKQNVLITFAVESKNEYGETANYAATQVNGEPGKPVAIALGDLKLSFTPRVINQE